MATIDSLKEILNENLDIEPEKVVESATFDELGIDSLDMAELICDIEERLDVEFGEPEGLETVGSGEYIDSQPNAAADNAVALGRGHCLWLPSPSFVFQNEAAFKPFAKRPSLTGMPMWQSAPK